MKNLYTKERMNPIAMKENKFKHIMIDTETLGRAPGSVVRSVAAIEFDPQTGEVIDQGTLDHLTGQLTAFGEFIQRVKI